MRFNELLAARYNEFISAVLGLAEQEGVHSVAPELMPMFVAEGERLEHSFLKNERKCFGDISRGADAANFSYVGLLNPAGSNAIITLEKFYGLVSTAGTIIGGIVAPPGATTLLPTVGTLQTPRDVRYSAQGTSGKLCSGINALGTATDAFGRWSIRGLAANVSTNLDIDCVLFPGWAFAVTATAINIGVTASVQWRERAFLPEENP